MVKLRLQRYGAKKRPFYKIVAADSNSPRDGKFIEQLGFYAAAEYKENIKLKDDRVKYWLSVGARPTETVQYILKKKGLLETTGTVAKAV